MKFTDSLIRQVKAEFPHDEDLHKALERGDSHHVGQALSTYSLMEITPEQLIRALKTGKAKRLLARAEAARRAERLHKEFQRETGKERFYGQTFG